jgi:hypothetical protein
MTEAEWLECDDPSHMVITLRYMKLSERRFRLCACACCREMWHNLADPRIKAAVVAAEQFADGTATEDDLGQAHEDAIALMPPSWQQITRYVQFERLSPAERVDYAAARVAESVTRYEGGWHFSHHLEDVIDNTLQMAADQAFGLEREAVARTIVAILHDIFASAFRPVALDPTWRTPAVLAVAQAAYAERTSPQGHLAEARLAVLSDALEEAGCTDRAVLEHLRSAGPHVRGCWPVDLLLEKQ